MSQKAVATKPVRPGSFVVSQPRMAEERKVFSIMSGANTERPCKKRKLSEDHSAKKEHYIKSIKNILKVYNQRKKTKRPSAKKVTLKATCDEPKVAISSAVIEQLSDLRMEAANVSAQLNNQLFQIKKHVCTTSLQLTDFYDSIIEVLSAAKAQQQAAIEGAQAFLSEELGRYLQKTDANLEVLDSLLAVFSKEARINASDVPVLADIVQQARLPPINLEFVGVHKQFDFTLKERLVNEVAGIITLSEARMYSQSFEVLNSIADKVISKFEWSPPVPERLLGYVSSTKSTDTKRRELSEGALEQYRQSPRIRAIDLSKATGLSKGSFHHQTYSLTREKQSVIEDITSYFNFKTVRPPAGH